MPHFTAFASLLPREVCAVFGDFVLTRLLRQPRGERYLFPTLRANPLPVVLGSIGHCRETAMTYDWNGRQRGGQFFALFQYTLAGEGHLRVGRREQAVRPGDAMLIHFPAENRYRLPASSAAWEFIYLCLTGPEIQRAWPAIEKRHGPLIALPPDSPPVNQAAALVHAGLRDELTSPYLVSARAYAWLMQLQATLADTRARGPQAAILDRTMHWAETHVAESIGVADLAQVAGLSRFHFTRLFTHHTGLSPAAWLTDQRIRHAARLLRESDLPIKEIARHGGFRDVSYFGKVFQRHTGQPPGSYRRSGV
jgi:AraC-like DNA-binding protein